MMAKKSYRCSTRWNDGWRELSRDPSDWHFCGEPTDKEERQAIIIGCLQRIADAQEGLYALAKAEAARKAEIAKGFSMGGTGGLLGRDKKAKARRPK